MATISDVLPEFCIELQRLIAAAGHRDLVGQVRDLPIVSRCACGEANCAHFYTAEPPHGAYGAGHWNVMLNVSSGLVVLDLVQDAIVAVEILDRPDVKKRLDAFLPVSRNPRYATRPLPCPACGFLTVTEPLYGSYRICEVCGWEDDPVQLANPGWGGGANSESLIEGQRAALAKFPVGVSATEGFARSDSWRPLDASEKASVLAQRGAMNSPIRHLAECYWVKEET